jgi:prolyl-tRNA editing enzyme YbaK/EbsC (Cys-tRNA(Pro) deacylase)
MPDDPTSPLPPLASAPETDRFVALAQQQGFTPELAALPAGTRTAPEAARAVGCDVGAIVKSLVFLADGDAVLALVSGTRRVDERALAAALSASDVRRATAAESEAAVGFALGVIPPFGHGSTALRASVCDPALLQHELVWAAAGSHDRMFPVAPALLLELSGARIADVAK